jgi:hypothetical protein
MPEDPDHDGAPPAERTPWRRDRHELAARSDSPLAEATRLHDIAIRRANDPVPADSPVSVPPRRERRDRRADPASPLLRAIRDAAALDGLELSGSPTDHRYGRVVDVRASADGRRYDLALRLFRRPADDGPDFREALAAQFDRWAALSDIDGVVPVVDAATDPRPWTCTAPAGDALADCSFTSLSARLRHARALTGTLAAVHDRGAVHAGLDPAHVVYPPGTDRPQLDGVGLLDVYRRYADPADYLDPRYAPPELFDDRYGVVDRVTDVYGLGAVLYRIFTGQAPYDGTPAEIREAVLTEPFPRPSAVADVPAAIDDVVARATATDKFDRYGSVAALDADVRDCCRRVLDEK